MEQDSVMGFSWDFIDEIGLWSLAIGLVTALVGGYLLGSVGFAVGCLVAIGVDVVLVRIATHRGRRALGEGRVDSVAPTVMLAGRLLAKTALLVIALFVPVEYVFTGTIVGVLTFDVTLALVGSVLAASRTMRHTKEGR